MATWRSACSYALIVAVGSWVTGAAVGLAWSAAADDLGGWASFWVANPVSYVFVAGAALTLVATRRFTAPLPVWRTVLIDGGAYLLVLLSWAASGRGGTRPPCRSTTRSSQRDSPCSTCSCRPPGC
ncbi:hypothetical protein LUX12_10430 [Streptomyces somaliensis]|uniref:hypothetical protein n=1 Tax=Streptomyces somaliensis TaxID=78355 RepID=UPI0020CF2F86|nr:hypothetical protein [Streptomyces somaliensis]MCP9945105.1 hypothetical protein [Streptomyces somaliensis]MCP9961680.1 hypothetical protein [Streptomyces somaliensis]MCP9974493.1 hypothetical protein [Streptomyces somaliensis]